MIDGRGAKATGLEGGAGDAALQHVRWTGLVVAVGGGDFLGCRGW